MKDMISKDGKSVKQCIEFKSRDMDYTTERYKNGINRGKYIEDNGVFLEVLKHE